MKTQKSAVCLYSLVFLMTVHCAFALSPCQLLLDGDLNRDCKVDLADLCWLASNWLTDWSTQPGAFLPNGIYVAPPESGGYDTYDCGSMIAPCASVGYASQRALDSGKSYVFVANGIYQESVTLISGINLWGGFNPATWVRSEPAQSATVLVGIAAGPHVKTLSATSISAPTEVSRFQIKGTQPQQSGGNSYAVWIKDSTNALVLKDNLIYLGQGADGVDGDDGVGGIDGPDGIAGMGASNPIGSVVSGEWVGAAGTSGTDEVSGGKGGTAGGGAFGVFINNTGPIANGPTLTANVFYAGRGGNAGDGGWGGIGEQTGTGGGGGGGAGGMACGIYIRNVTNNPFYQNFNTFVGVNTAGNGGRGGKSFGNAGSDGVAGAALDYYYP